MQQFNYGGAKKTPQSQPIPGKNQVKNSAGGYTFQIDDLKMFRRFLILGTEGGNFYASEKEMNFQNIQTIHNLLKAGKGREVVDELVKVSSEGLASKNDAAIFSLAVVLSEGSDDEKRYAISKFNDVVRIGTHLLQFVDYADNMRGWGKNLKRAVTSWYTSKTAEKVAFQCIKYANRAGWTHKDVLRHLHLKPKDAVFNAVFKYIAKGIPNDGDVVDKATQMIAAYEEIKRTDNEKRILELVDRYKFPMEFIPTEKRSKKVWEHILPNSGMTFLIRNLGNLSKQGLLVDSNFGLINMLEDKFTNVEQIKAARLHPMQILLAMDTYGSGKGFKGSNTWNVSQRAMDILDKAFYLAFDAIETSGKRFMLSVDVSGSMTWATSNIAGTNISSRKAAACMCMATYKSERNTFVKGFSSEMVDIPIGKNDRLDAVMDKMGRVPAGATDCAKPMIYATEQRIPIDTFVIYTDNETWCGNIHPSQALEQYRQKMGINAKLAVCAFAVNNFSIADPKDLGMMDFVGMSADTPKFLSAFSAGVL